MVDPAVFAKAWAMICERFNREHTKDLSKFYYDEVSGRMDTEAFEGAARRVLNENEFFPKPSDFWRFDESLAIDQWELCERVASGERGILERMNAAGRRVVCLLGGPNHLGMTTPEKLGWVRRDFLALYQEVSSVPDRQAIEGPEVTPESRRIVGDVMGKLKP